MKLRLGSCRCCLLLIHITIHNWFWWLCSAKWTTNKICIICSKRYCVFWRTYKSDSVQRFEWWWIIKTLQPGLLTVLEVCLITCYFKTIWPEEIELLFNMYRVGVFFWILMGLVWLSGVISIITELLQGLIQNDCLISIQQVQMWNQCTTNS